MLTQLKRHRSWVKQQAAELHSQEEPTATIYIVPSDSMWVTDVWWLWNMETVFNHLNKLQFWMDEQRLHMHSETHSNTLRREFQGSVWTDLGGTWLYNSLYILPTILLMLLAGGKTWRSKWLWLWCTKPASPCDQRPATRLHAKAMHIRTFVLQCLTVTICLVTKSDADW